MPRYFALRVRLLRRLAPVLTQARWALAASFAARAARLAVVLAPPLLLRSFIDDVIVGRRFGLVACLLSAFLAVFMAETALQCVELAARNRAASRIALRVRHRNLEAALMAGASAGAGDLKRAVEEDVTHVDGVLQEHVLGTLLAGVRLLALAVILAAMSWHLALIGFAFAGGISLISGRLATGARETGVAMRRADGVWDNWLARSLRGWMEIKTLQLERRETDAVSRVRIPAQQAAGRLNLVRFGNRVMGQAVDELATRAALYFVGAVLIFAGTITAGVLIAFVRYYATFVEDVRMLRENNIAFHEAAAAVERALALHAEHPLDRIRAQEWGERGPARPVSVTVSGATYLGEGRAPVVDRATLAIPAGAFVCIAGESGSGKTTLIRLIAGDLRPAAGSVLLDGVPATAVPPRALRDTFARVGDDSAVLNISIRDNLLLAAPGAADGELWEALATASFDREIRALPGGLDTLIGERGMKLSGGQRQRLLLARALLLDRAGLLLDEATSQVDPRADQEIQNRLRRLSGRKTVVTVAHRLASVQAAAAIFVIEDGRVMAHGTHDRLMADSAAYRRLFASQAA